MDTFFDTYGYLLGAIVLLGLFIKTAKFSKQETGEAQKEVHCKVLDEDAVWPTSEEQGREIAKRNTDIMMQTMRNLGCQPEQEVDDEFAFHVTYQGEVFTFSCAYPYIRIYDLAWGGVKGS